MTPRTIGLASVVLLIGTAGCGGADPVERYVGQVNHAQERFAETVGRLSGRVTDTSSTAEDRRTARAFTAAVEEVVVELRNIDPPSRVAGLHRELVSDIDTYGSRIESADASLRSHDVRRLAAAQQRLLDATKTVSTQIRDTIEAINRRLGLA